MPQPKWVVELLLSTGTKVPIVKEPSSKKLCLHTMKLLAPSLKGGLVLVKVE